MPAGVYLIVHRATGRAYVGSTSDIAKRWSRHRQELRDGTHKNRHLQAAWNLYGPETFDWRVLATTPPEHRIEVEQWAIDWLEATNPDKGFNSAPVAGVSYGGTGRTWTPEQRARASVAQKLLKPAQPPGALCLKGHVKDGTYIKVRANGSIKVRCQECERTAGRERERKRRGIPPDHPRGKHFNRRGNQGGDA